jgi:hypothetical protein
MKEGAPVGVAKHLLLCDSMVNKPQELEARTGTFKVEEEKASGPDISWEFGSCPESWPQEEIDGQGSLDLELQLAQQKDFFSGGEEDVGRLQTEDGPGSNARVQHLAARKVLTPDFCLFRLRFGE